MTQKIIEKKTDHAFSLKVHQDASCKYDELFVIEQSANNAVDATVNRADTNIETDSRFYLTSLLMPHLFLSRSYGAIC